MKSETDYKSRELLQVKTEAWQELLQLKTEDWQELIDSHFQRCQNLDQNAENHDSHFQRKNTPDAVQMIISQELDFPRSYELHKKLFEVWHYILLMVTRTYH
jgi:hypothetical protein